MNQHPLALILVPALALAGCGSPQQPAAEAPVETQAAEPAAPANEAAPVNAVDTTAITAAAAAAPAVFAQCAVCHSVAKGGKAGVGPNLWGTAGTPAAQKPGFAYSPALRSAGLVWDDATLDKWLQKPMALVPGTRMTFAGLPDAAKREAVIAYLKTLR